MVEVKSPLVQSSKLLKSKSKIQKPYVFPFIPLYGVFYNIYTTKYDKYIGGQEWTFVYLGSIISLNLLFWLMPAWNTSVDVLFNYSEVSTLEEAEFIFVQTTPNNGSAGIVKIEAALEQGVLQTFFQFQKKRFLLDESHQFFSSPKFLIDEPLKLDFFQKNNGNSGDLTHSKRLFGDNSFDIPIPTFLELYKEHCVAPFFVFQVFCVALWFLDDMWYYSLFNLFMIVAMEGATVFQRLTTLKEFRTMGIKPFPINTFRDGKWELVQTNELLPNDLVSIVRSEDETAIPCDLVLVDGSCIVNEAMLSGESTPLLKESIKLRPGNEFIDIEGVDKNSLLHGGTKCLQVTKPENPTTSSRKSPDDGCLAVVTKTGFETSQGSLVRVMLFSAEQVSANNKEAFAFIGFLLIFAIAASWYVWVEGTNMGRVHSKLILDCVLIITSVVPPELPMELTMAVNASLSALSKFYVYCTEPFRIPLAGRIDVCCFDKTGTLTGEDLVFEGVAGLKLEQGIELIQPDSSMEETTIAIGSCQALVKLEDGEIVGDPMEKATLKSCGWSVDSKSSVTHKELGKVQVLRRFQFSSALKRSSAIASFKNKMLVTAKGAPEVLRERLSVVPANYDDVYKHYTRHGSRVLALAVKDLDNGVKVDKLDRKVVESDLKFVGFLIYHCPLKDDAIETIQMLNESSHRCIMITGDNPLTAVHVGRQVAIVEKDVLIIDRPSESGESNTDELIIRNVEETYIKKFNPLKDEFKDIFGKYDLAVTGYALNLLYDHKQIKELLRNTWVYARVSPTQKEYILNELKSMGYQTLMCGDGTNDVGALKQAHVGIALLNGTEEGLKKMADQRRMDGMKQMYNKQCDMFNRWGKPSPPVPEFIAHLYPPSALNPHYLKALEKQGKTISDEERKEFEKAMKQPIKQTAEQPIRAENVQVSDMADMFMNSLNSAGEDGDEDTPTLKLGDASCAAPFTSKLSKVSAVTNIVRQGRCALINTIQMYKILALNCLISAYSLSIMFIMGVKFGDSQATVSGILLSSCFLSISRGKPIEKLSKERPQAGIFNIYIMGSILSQFAVHCGTLLYLTSEIYKLEPREPVLDLDKTFEPSLLNTGIFLIQLIQQVSTFYVNYQGEPFRENIRNNKGMFYGIVGVFALAFAGATEFLPELNQAIKFVPMEEAFKIKLTGVLLLDFFGAYACEHVFKFFFMDDKPADIAHK